jgi:hypothetical protein
VNITIEKRREWPVTVIRDSRDEWPDMDLRNWRALLCPEKVEVGFAMQGGSVVPGIVTITGRQRLADGGTADDTAWVTLAVNAAMGAEYPWLLSVVVAAREQIAKDGRR